MQIKYGFKFKLLLSTFLFSGVCNTNTAYSKSFRTDVELPSVEVNFAVIQELRQKEIARLKEESRRIKEAQRAAQYRAMQEQQNRAVNNYDSDNSRYERGYVQRPVENTYEKEYKEQYVGSYEDNYSRQQRYLNKYEQAEQQSNQREKVEPAQRQQVKSYLQQEQYSQQLYNQQFEQKRSSVDRRYVEKRDVKREEPQLFSALPPKNPTYTSEPFTSPPFEAVSDEEPYKTVLPRLKPGSELSYYEDNSSKSEVVSIEEPFLEEREIVKETYFDQIVPGRHQSFIKVTEVPRKQERVNETNSPKVSYFNFPKVEKEEPKQVQRILPKEIFDENEALYGKPIELIDIPNKLPEDEVSSNDTLEVEPDEVSQSNYKVEKRLPKKSTDFVDNIIKAPIGKKNVEQSEFKSTWSNKNDNLSNSEDKKESFISVVNNKVKNLFSLKDKGEEKSKDDIVDNDSSETDVIKRKVAKVEQIKKYPELNKKEISNFQEQEEENKALIPVEVNELDEIVKQYSNDYTKPVYLDGVSNITDWQVPDDVMKKLNSDIKRKPYNIASARNGQKIIMPNAVDNRSVNNIVPKPRVKPFTGVADEVSNVQKIITPVIRRKETKVIEEVSPVSRANKKISQDNSLNNINSRQKVSDIKVEKESTIVLPNEVLNSNKNLKPLSDDKWNEELEKARLEALAIQDDKKKEKIDLTKFKNLLKKESKEESDVKRRPSSNPMPKNTPAPMSEVLKNKENKQQAEKKADNSGNGILYLEDIAKSLKKNKQPKEVSVARSTSNVDLTTKGSSLIAGNIIKNNAQSKVTELVGHKVVLPSSEMEMLNKTTIAAKPKFEGLLKINFNEDQLELSKADSEKINKLVEDIKGSNKKVAIVSYASNKKVDNARRISLKRAIAVRSAMLDAGMSSDMVHVQAAGVAEKKRDENSVNISFAN